MADSSSTIYDVAIIGGGPSGLSASIFLGRYLHSVVVIDSGDPRNWETRGINGYLGLPSVRPAELRGLGRDEARRYGVSLIDGYVSCARKLGEECFVVEYEPIGTTKAEANRRGPGVPSEVKENARALARRGQALSVRARRLLLAFGLKDEWPRVPGLRQVYGSWAHVCPDCDGYETRDQRAAVIAKGRKAVGMALNLTTWTRDIVVCTNGEEPGFDEMLRGKLDGLGIPVETDPITCIHTEPDGTIRTIELGGGRQLEVDHIFFALGQRPAEDLGGILGCERDADGHIVVDRHYQTSVYNVFAVGDIIPGAQLAIAGAADGAIAALAIHKSLVPPQRKLEPLHAGDADKH